MVTAGNEQLHDFESEAVKKASTSIRPEEVDLSRKEKKEEEPGFFEEKFPATTLDLTHWHILYRMTATRHFEFDQDPKPALAISKVIGFRVAATLKDFEWSGRHSYIL